MLFLIWIQLHLIRIQLHLFQLIRIQLPLAWPFYRLSFLKIYISVRTIICLNSLSGLLNKSIQNQCFTVRKLTRNNKAIKIAFTFLVINLSIVINILLPWMGLRGHSLETPSTKKKKKYNVKFLWFFYTLGRGRGHCPFAPPPSTPLVVPHA